MLKTMLSRAIILMIFLPLLLSSARAGMSLPKQIRYDITAVIGPTSEGFGVTHGAAGTRVTDPVEPNAQGVLGIGVDTNNPRPFGSMREVWFGPAGNIDDRPQREISIHWNGREIANRFCDEDLQNPFGVHINVEIDHVPGGAEITITAGKHKIYDHFYVHGAAVSSAPRAAGDANVTLSPVSKSGKFSAIQGKHLIAVDKVVNDASRHTIRQKVQFPTDAAAAGRAILTLTLAPTTRGLDAWDRFASVRLHHKDGQTYELVRYITPYRRAWEWTIDVSDLTPLFTGDAELEVFCETYGEGWTVSVAFDFYQGMRTDGLRPVKVINLWNGNFPIGYAKQPFEKAVTPKTFNVPSKTAAVKVRTMVTGHGMSPNTGNAGEFYALWRRIEVGERQWYDLLWKTDVYLNPVRPQGGTWKFSRAGWAPGSIAEAWTVDITGAIKVGSPVTVGYGLEPFVNKTPNEGFLAAHVIGSQAILFEKAK